MALTPADKARAAHSALVLVENGVQNASDAERLAGYAADAPTEGPQVVGGEGSPLVGTAKHLVEVADARTLDRYTNMGLTDLYAEWVKQVEANLAENHPHDLAAVHAADQEALARTLEADAVVQEGGDWPRDARKGYAHARRPGDAANALYDYGREGCLAGGVDWDTAVIKLVLVDAADYAVNLASHQFLSSVAGAGRVATSAALASKTVAAGVADAADVVLSAVTGDPSEAVIVYQSSAVGGGGDVADTAQRLIAYIDTATGLPITPNGGDITIAFDSGANRIFKL